MKPMKAIPRRQAMALVESGAGYVSQFCPKHDCNGSEDKNLAAWNADKRNHQVSENVLAVFFEPSRDFYGAYYTPKVVLRIRQQEAAA